MKKDATTIVVPEKKCTCHNIPNTGWNALNLKITKHKNFVWWKNSGKYKINFKRKDNRR